MLRNGVFLQERYEIIELIGSGGMSDVYKAQCHKLNRLVAIKVLKREFSSDSNFVNKFKREAQAAARLSHPNIVNVYDVVDEEDLHYIVMELIEGVTLKNYITKKRMLETKECIGIALQVAQGMAAAHEQNIIHRDIKPQNIIISKDGKVKVADFGIARAISEQTMTSSAIGSVHYISPEQAKGKYSDVRSDIYSLGVTMYEMITGKVPFEGDNTVTVALAHLNDPVVHPSVYNGRIPTSLENIILKCMEKKPERRYPNVTELIADLRKVLISPDTKIEEPISISSQTAYTRTISEEELSQIAESAHIDKRQKSRPQKQSDINPQIEKLMTAAGVIVAILIVCIVLFVFSQIFGLFRFGSGKNNTSFTESGQNSESLADTEVYMPGVLGLPQDMAEAKLKEYTLVMRVSGYENSDEYDKGEIMKQETPEGEIISKYSTVSVVISEGSDSIKLSSLLSGSMDQKSAEKILEQNGIKSVIEIENSETVLENQLIRYSPERIKKGETVTLYISSGPYVQMVSMPELKGKSESDATVELTALGLTPGEITREPSTSAEAGQVTHQEIPAGAEVPIGSAVAFTVSTGIEETTSSKRFIASISETYDVSNLIGPGSSISIKVSIRLKQTVDGQDIYTTLMEPRTVNGNSLLPVNFKSIEGAQGIESGEVEIIDVSSGAVIKSYTVIFYEM